MFSTERHPTAFRRRSCSRRCPSRRCPVATAFFFWSSRPSSHVRRVFHKSVNALREQTLCQPTFYSINPRRQSVHPLIINEGVALLEKRYALGAFGSTWSLLSYAHGSSSTAGPSIDLSMCLRQICRQHRVTQSMIPRRASSQLNLFASAGSLLAAVFWNRAFVRVQHVSTATFRAHRCQQLDVMPLQLSQWLVPVICTTVLPSSNMFLLLALRLEPSGVDMLALSMVQCFRCRSLA